MSLIPMGGRGDAGQADHASDIQDVTDVDPQDVSDVYRGLWKICAHASGRAMTMISLSLS
jgi:hypothetical protein